MRFYKRDGSCKINQEDSEFGWWLHDISAGDKIRAKRPQNESLISEQNEVEDSVDLTCLFECSKELIVEKHEPSVEIHVPVSAQRSQMSPEGYVRADNLNPFNLSDAMWCPGVKAKQNKKLPEYENPNSMRTRMSDMITPDTLEGRLLISLIDFPRFKILPPKSSPVEAPRPNPIPELQRRSIFFHNNFIWGKLNDSPWMMKNERYNRKRKSILEETSFKEFITNKYCPREIPLANKYPANHKETRQALKAPEKLNCLPLDCLKLSETDACGDKFLECTEVLYLNLGRLNETIREMQVELIDIRLDLQEEDRRTARLLQESRKLTRELRESNYLNEVLLLLMGQAEKIKSNKWPFKICSNRKAEAANLIV